MSDEQSKPEPETAPGERMELPTWNRGRTKKRGGAEPTEDAFQVGVKEVGRGAARRAPLVAVGAVLAVGAIVVAVVMYSRGQQASAAATRLLGEAATYEARAEVGDPELLLGKSKRRPPAPVVKDEAERAAAVDKALAELMAQAGGTAAAQDGTLMMAARLMRDGKFPEAEAAYRQFLDAAGAGHPLRWAAREGLGFAREAQNDLDSALAEFKTLAGEKGVFYRDMGLWHQGRVLERQGKTDEALAIYRQYIAEFPLGDPSIAQTEVRKRLEELDPSAVASAQLEPPVQVMDTPPGAAP
ncbi:MAG TPA: tetratricopeptide repeat protein [Nannocystis sp.]